MRIDEVSTPLFIRGIGSRENLAPTVPFGCIMGYPRRRGR